MNRNHWSKLSLTRPNVNLFLEEGTTIRFMRWTNWVYNDWFISSDEFDAFDFVVWVATFQNDIDALDHVVVLRLVLFFNMRSLCWTDGGCIATDSSVAMTLMHWTSDEQLVSHCTPFIPNLVYGWLWWNLALINDLYKFNQF